MVFSLIVLKGFIPSSFDLNICLIQRTIKKKVYVLSVFI